MYVHTALSLLVLLTDGFLFMTHTSLSAIFSTVNEI